MDIFDGISICDMELSVIADISSKNIIIEDKGNNGFKSVLSPISTTKILEPYIVNIYLI